MSLFGDINKNLYYMYFKPLFGCKNQYEYIKLVYGWNPDAVKRFESGRFNIYKTANYWLNHSISIVFFDAKQSADMEYNVQEMFQLCFRHLKETLLVSGMEQQKLAGVIHDLIYEPETVREPFEWDVHTGKKLAYIYKRCSLLETLAVLLIHAQTEQIYNPVKKQELSSSFSYVKGGRNLVLDYDEECLLQDTFEVNIAAIMLSSQERKLLGMIAKQLQRQQNIRLNILLMDPKYPEAETFFQQWLQSSSKMDILGQLAENLDYLQKLRRQFGEKISVRTIASPLSYGLTQFKKNRDDSVIKLELYTTHFNFEENYSYLLDSRENQTAYAFYSRNFYQLFHSPFSKELEADIIAV